MISFRRVARILQRGGLFWKLEITVNELDPNFHQSCQNQVIFITKGLHQFWNGFSGRNQVISKKKTSSPIFGVRSRRNNSTFLFQITASPSQLLFPNPLGGLFSFSEQKSASKALKTCYFAYSSGQ